MRWSILALCAATLAACATAPRYPATIDYRGSESRSPGAGIGQSSPACDPGAQIEVQPGDTLSEIAEDCGVATRDLAVASGVSQPNQIQAGTELTVPRPSSHTVRQGENLYRIGLRYNISYQELAAHNGIPAPYNINVGQVINLPGSPVRTASLEPPRTTPTPRPRASTPPRSSEPSFSSSSPNREAPSRPPVRVEQASEPSGPVTFQWPIRGTVISDFGPKPDGRRNDGLNIDADEGDSVRASAAGTVVYAGGELAGYGELVLIRHAGGWVTAYAHNSRLRVAEGDRVDQGQIIAEAGSTGSVDTAQVHFEIRRGVTPEDPTRHLPES